MKKLLFVFLILLLTGCVKEKVLCTLNSEYSETGITKQELTGMFNGDNELVDMELTFTFVNNDRALEMCDLFEMANEYQDKSNKVKFDCNDNTLTITDYKGVLNNIKTEEKDIMGKSKEDFIKIINNKGYKCQ